MGWRIYSVLPAEEESRRFKNAKDSAKKAIDRAAGHARTKYITAVEGQSLTYQLKEKEALAYKAAGYPEDPEELNNYPFLVGEVDATGMTHKQAADTILYMASLWTPLAVAIENLRIKYKTAVDSAITMEEIKTYKKTGIGYLKQI